MVRFRLLFFHPLLLLQWGLLGSENLAEGNPPPGLDPARRSLIEDLNAWKRAETLALEKELPLILNANVQAGALLTPSARMSPDGQLAFGGGATKPFLSAGLGIQLMPRLNLAINTLKLGKPTQWADLSTGWREPLSRQVLLKLQILGEKDLGLGTSLAIGSNDLFDLGVGNSFYAVATQSFPRLHLEGSVGWSHGPQTGWFASAIWSPFRLADHPLAGISFVGEWAGAPLRGPFQAEACGWSEPHRAHLAAVYRLKDILQFSVGTLGGEETYVGVALQADLGGPIKGLPKFLDRPLHAVSSNWEPLGGLRADRDLAVELAQAFEDHRLLLQGVWLETGPEGGKTLRLRVVNQSYTWLSDLREQVERILAAMVPAEIESVSMVLSAYGADSQQITWKTSDLHQWFTRQISAPQLHLASPQRSIDRIENATTLFKRPVNTWQWDVQPYSESVWLKNREANQGVYGIAMGPQGTFLDHYFYRARLNITGWNGLTGCDEQELLTPSPTVIVRSDMILYNLQGKLRLSEAFVQRTWSSPKGLYLRASAGYYDLAFAGACVEALWYPVNSFWALGIEAAPLLKRRYGGLGFTSSARFGDGCWTPCRSFYPWQLFVDLYGYFEPWAVELKGSFGHFIARDVGLRLEATKFWPSGMRITVWGSWSRLPDSAGGGIFADRGLGFSIPLDILLPRRSRGRYQYGTGAVYPDIGARVTTGIPLYRLIADERRQKPQWPPLF